MAETVGQDHLLGSDGPIGRMVAQRRVASMILWGPPGCGKTTLARLIAATVKSRFVPFSAVTSSISDVKRSEVVFPLVAFEKYALLADIQIARHGLGLADPDCDLALGYVMNRMDIRVRSPRCLALCHALYGCI